MFKMRRSTSLVNLLDSTILWHASDFSEKMDVGRAWRVIENSIRRSIARSPQERYGGTRTALVDYR